MVVVDVSCWADDCIHNLPGRQQLIKAECEWLLEPDIVVAAADGCFNEPKRLQQMIAGISQQDCSRLLLESAIVVAAAACCWNQPLWWLQQMIAGISQRG